MKPSTHRYILAPTLIGIHAILLLPLIFPPKTLRPPHFPDASGHPWPAYEAAPQQQKVGRLHLKYSVPFGFAGIAGVWISKQLAGNIPLPKDPRRKLLAMWLESSVLFGIGVLEEIWRYGLVRLLVGYMGGHEGYRGSTVMRRDEGDFEGPPTLWEGLYIMAWVWSIFECLVCRNPHFGFGFGFDFGLPRLLFPLFLLYLCWKFLSLSPSFDLCYISTSRKYTSIHH
jgi:hypothetical protein